MPLYQQVSHISNRHWIRDILLICLITAVPFLQYLGALPLIDPDEGRYAEIPREMLERGDFITPTLNYVKYFEKPPLLYWINSASMQILGTNEFAARLPAALCGILTIASTYIIARKLFDRRTALLSAAILGSTAGFIIQSRIILTDMLLTFCLVSALGSFIVACVQPRKESGSIPWLLFYLFCALAVLAKGLIGMVFPAGIIFVYLLASGQWNILKRMHLAAGTIIFLAVTVPWFVAVSMKNPEFPRFFFIHEHFERFTSTVHGRYQPIWFFIPVLAGTMFPWSFFIPGALSDAWKNKHSDEGMPKLYLIIWILLIFAFFSKSSSKLVPYILPIFPPLAILIANRFANIVENRVRGITASTIAIGAASLVLALGAFAYANLPQATDFVSGILPSAKKELENFTRNAPSLGKWSTTAIALVFLLQSSILLFRGKRNGFPVFCMLCGSSFILVILVTRLILPPIASTESAREMAFTAKPLITEDTRVITFGPMQGVNWYLKRRTMVTGKIDELEFGSRQGDQSAWFPDMAQFSRIWMEDQLAVAFMKKREFESLGQELKARSRVIRESGRYVAVVNRLQP